MTNGVVNCCDTTDHRALKMGNPKDYSSPEKSAVIQRSGRMVNSTPG